MSVYLPDGMSVLGGAFTAAASLTEYTMSASFGQGRTVATEPSNVVGISVTAVSDISSPGTVLIGVLQLNVAASSDGGSPVAGHGEEGVTVPCGPPVEHGNTRGHQTATAGAWSTAARSTVYVGSPPVHASSGDAC